MRHSMKTSLIYICLALGCHACQPSSTDTASPVANPTSTTTREDSDIDHQATVETPRYDPGLGVKSNLVLASNSIYTIRVDEMNDGDYRYISWDPDQKTVDSPKMIIYNGALVDEGSWGRAFSFDHDGITYQLTDYTAAGDPSVNLILKKGSNLQKSTILKSQK